jgi:hypothetical protein
MNIATSGWLRRHALAYRFAAGMLLASALLTSACANDKEPRMLTPGVTGYNHTKDEITFSVNNQAGGYLMPHTGGGKSSCCVSIPRTWSPGTKVKVLWQKGMESTERVVDVDVPAYDTNKVGALNVHFLRTGEIRVFATMLDLRHPDYPLKGPEAQLRPDVPAR